MGKKCLIIIFLLFSVFCMIPKVYAEEDSCTYKEKANLNKLAGSVETSYSIINNDDGTHSFKISIYNIVEGISVTVKNDYDSSSELIVVSGMTNNGTYSFLVPDSTNIIKYEFIIRATSNCTGELKKLTLTKPKRNIYHDYLECQYADTEGYTYCAEWITKDITIPESEVLKKIEQQRSYKSKQNTTKCVNCTSNVRNSAQLNVINNYKILIVIGLSIGIALNMIYIYITISNIRRSEL